MRIINNISQQTNLLELKKKEYLKNLSQQLKLSIKFVKTSKY